MYKKNILKSMVTRYSVLCSLYNMAIFADLKFFLKKI
jgi:hypothetical protein